MRPRVVVQRVEAQWLLSVTHTDGTWQVPLYLGSEADAKLQGRRLAQRYATAKAYSVEEDRRLAACFAQELVEARPGAGVTELEIREHRHGWTIYRRHGREVHMERLSWYVVLAPDGRAMEEFRQFRNAQRWCDHNHDYAQEA
jgi:hypothetical protein